MPCRVKIGGRGNLQVVDVHIVKGNFLEASWILRVLEEKTRNPIIALVVLDSGRGTVRAQQVIAFGVDAKVTSSHDAVIVGGFSSRINHRVHRALGQELVCGKVQDGEGPFCLNSSSQGGHNGQ